MTARATVIRPARSADAPQLAVLGTQVWLDNYAKDGIHPSIAQYVLDTFTPAHFESMLDDAARLIVVAERGRHVVGMAIVALGNSTPLCTERESAQAEIERLYVQEPFCNTGIGTRLLTAIDAALSERGMTTIWLQAWIQNARALHFYAKRGFVDAGITFFELNGKKHENRVLVKPVHRP